MKNSIVLITGASSGIGAACAIYFAKQGSNVLLCARRLERVQALAEELITNYAIKAHAFKLDVTNIEEVNTVLANLPTAWQAIDVLINNAGLALGLDKLQDGNPENWDCMIDTNIKGLLYVTRAIIPGMIARQQGHIINLGSIAGHEVYPGGNVYGATKFAVNALTRSLRLDLIGTPLRVSSVDPGMVETEFSNVRFNGDEQRAKSVYAGLQPLTPMDVADVVYYCASRPAHVNVQDVIVMPTAQAAVTHVHRVDK